MRVVFLEDACVQQAVWQDGGRKCFERKMFVSLAFER